VGESSFWYRPTRVVPDQRPLNGRCCCCISDITCMECKDAADCYRCSVVCNVCLSDVMMSCANMAEPITMPFVMWTSGGPKEPCIRRGVWIPHGKVQFFLGGGERAPPYDAVFHQSSLVTCCFERDSPQ